MQNLVSQAELRVLQAQINPHFLFNSLNTLYGAIQRENAPARRLVTNLASLFRYALGSERSFIGLAEELRIVRAYLEIEQLRLGPRLTTSFEIDEAALPAEIPVFSIQPLVENAIRHGVAIRRGSGFVKVAIHRREREIRIVISNSGPFRQPAPDNGNGIGLMNVRKRLSLCYGAESQLKIESGEDHTEVSFTVPLSGAAKAMAQSIR
jgi:two-component system LytT family sensor kinase